MQMSDWTTWLANRNSIKSNQMKLKWITRFLLGGFRESIITLSSLSSLLSFLLSWKCLKSYANERFRSGFGRRWLPGGSGAVPTRFGTRWIWRSIWCLVSLTCRCRLDRSCSCCCRFCCCCCCCYCFYRRWIGSRVGDFVLCVGGDTDERLFCLFWFDYVTATTCFRFWDSMTDHSGFSGYSGDGSDDASAVAVNRLVLRKLYWGCCCCCCCCCCCYCCCFVLIVTCCWLFLLFELRCGGRFWRAPSVVKSTLVWVESEFQSECRSDWIQSALGWWMATQKRRETNRINVDFLLFLRWRQIV